MCTYLHILDNITSACAYYALHTSLCVLGCVYIANKAFRGRSTIKFELTIFTTFPRTINTIPELLTTLLEINFSQPADRVRLRR